MYVPVWLLALLIAAVVLLVVLLGSARMQRQSRVRVHPTESIDTMLPSISGLTGSWMVEGNRVRILYDGDGFFPPFLESIRGARHSIHVETFAWWKGDICELLSQALAAKAREGVEVRLLLDYVGSRRARARDLERMREAGVELVRFRPPELRALGRLNQRTHRKLAVFDGRHGYVMGHGFAEEWEGDGRSPGTWSDRGARVEGPVVGQIQAAFARNWVEETGEVLAGDDHFPHLEPAGEVRCQVIPSLPRGGVSPATLLHKMSLATVNDELLIQNPYFCPDGNTMELLAAAAERGVRVRILGPGPVTDSPAVLHAGHVRFRRLLDAGVEMYELQPTMPHQKVMVVDGRWCILGSMNFDERSFGINAEIALGILDETICGELRRDFEGTLEDAVVIDPEVWARRSLAHRAVDRLAFLAHGLM